MQESVPVLPFSQPQPVGSGKVALQIDKVSFVSGCWWTWRRDHKPMHSRFESKFCIIIYLIPPEELSTISTPISLSSLASCTLCSMSHPPSTQSEHEILTKRGFSWGHTFLTAAATSKHNLTRFYQRVVSFHDNMICGGGCSYLEWASIFVCTFVGDRRIEWWYEITVSSVHL